MEEAIKRLLNANGNLQETLSALLAQPIKLTVHQHEQVGDQLWHRHISVSLANDPSVVLYEARSEVTALEERFGALLATHNLGQVFKMAEYSNPNFHLRNSYLSDTVGFGREYRLWREGLYDCLIREDYTLACLQLIRSSKLY